MATAMSQNKDELMPLHPGRSAYDTQPDAARKPGKPRSFTDEIGYRFLFSMFAGQHLLRGFTGAFSAAAEPYIFASYNLPAAQLQIFTTVSSLPYACKFLPGVVSDLCPILGYHKRPYMLLTSAAGVVAYAIISLAPKASLAPLAIAGLILVAKCQEATCDVLIEAQMSKKVREHPAHGPLLPTFWSGGLAVFSLVANLVYGPVTNSGLMTPSGSLIICMFAAVVIVPVTILNFHDETWVTRQHGAELRGKLLGSQKEVMFAGAIIVVVAILLALLNVFNIPFGVRLGGALTGTGVMILALFVFMRPEIGKILCYNIIVSVCHVQAGGATFYFLTDSPEAFPEGPHFNPFFYTTVLSLVSGVGMVLGLVIFTRLLKRAKFRTLLLSIQIVCLVLTSFDVLLFSGVYKKLGIPDHLMVAGGQLIKNFPSTFGGTVTVLMLTKCCPKGMEATVFALLASALNSGNIIASYIGAGLIGALNINPTGQVGDSEQFKNLWIMSLIVALLYLVPCFFLRLLIPDATVEEELLVGNLDSATSGSLLAQWREERARAPAKAAAV